MGDKLTHWTVLTGDGKPSEASEFGRPVRGGLLYGCKMEEVVTIEGQQHATRIMGKEEHSLVGGFDRKRFAQQHDFVAELFQQIALVVRDVMIEQELHHEGADICLATSKSISPF